MKSYIRLLALLFGLLIIQELALTQTVDTLRARNWLSQQKLLFKQSSAPWSLSATDLKQLKDLTTVSPFANCSGSNTSNCAGVALPVAGLILKGQRTNADQVLLKWETLAEYNCKGFVLERQSFSNSNIFDSVFFVSSVGTSYSKSKYEDVDFNSFRGLSFYRVKQVDNDGHFTYSNIIQIDGSTGKLTVDVIPNPARSSSLRFYFTLPDGSQTIDFTIFNALGVSLLKKEKFTASTGYYDIRNSHFAPGYYFITVHTATSVYTKSFVITD